MTIAARFYIIQYKGCNNLCFYANYQRGYIQINSYMKCLSHAFSSINIEDTTLIKSLFMNVFFLCYSCILPGEYGRSSPRQL